MSCEVRCCIRAFGRSMTVSYFGRRVGGPPSQFSSLSWCRHVVFRWRGSVWKGVGREGLCVVVLWYALAYAIAQACRPDSKVCTDTQADEMIEFLRAYQATLRTLLSFMLVFYYQQLYDRAKSIFCASSFAPGQLPRARIPGQTAEPGVRVRVRREHPLA